MPNTETDQLAFVQMVSVKMVLGGFFRLFTREVTIADGFSIEVFRGERHIGSIRSKDVATSSDVKKRFDSIGVHHDDTLYQINLGSKPITLSGSFTTADGYTPGYKLELELGVVDPTQFTMRYRQQSDPVHIAKVALVGELNRYAALRSHDRLKAEELRFRTEHNLNVGNNKHLGLDVVRVHDVSITMDPHLLEKRNIVRKEDLTRTQVVEEQHTTAIKSQFGRDEKIKDTLLNTEITQLSTELQNIALQQDRRNQLYKLGTEKLIQQVSEMLDAGYSYDEIYKEYPAAQGLLSSPASGNPAGYISSPDQTSFSSRASQSTNAPDVLFGEVDTDTASPGGMGQQRINGLSRVELGINFMQVQLTEVQCRQIGRAESAAFLVYSIIAGGIADNGQMLVSDIIVQVNNQMVYNEQMLSDALRLRSQNNKISIQVLRGDRLITLQMDGVL